MSINTLLENPAILAELSNYFNTQQNTTNTKIIYTYSANQSVQDFATIELLPQITLNNLTIGKKLLFNVSGSAGSSSAFQKILSLYINESSFDVLSLDLAASNSPFSVCFQPYTVGATSASVNIQLSSGVNTNTNDYICITITEYL